MARQELRLNIINAACDLSNSLLQLDKLSREPLNVELIQLAGKIGNQVDHLENCIYDLNNFDTVNEND